MALTYHSVSPCITTSLGLRIKEDTRDILKFIANSISQLRSYEKGLDKYDQGEAKKIHDLIIDGSFKNRSFNGWSYPKDKGIWHITTFYAANIHEDVRKSNPAYKDFSEGKLFTLTFDGFVYIPGNLMFAFTHSNDFYSNNPTPHLTLLFNGYLKPKHSNDALAEFFRNNGKAQSFKNGYSYKVINIEGYLS